MQSAQSFFQAHQPGCKHALAELPTFSVEFMGYLKSREERTISGSEPSSENAGSVEPTEDGLQPGVPAEGVWVRTFDRSSNQHYYFHSKTRVTQWQLPAEGHVWDSAAYLATVGSEAGAQGEEEERTSDVNKCPKCGQEGHTEDG